MAMRCCGRRLKTPTDPGSKCARAAWLLRACPTAHAVGFRYCAEAAFCELAGHLLGGIPRGALSDLVRLLALDAPADVREQCACAC